MKTQKFLFCFLATILAGCVPSLYSLFIDKDAISRDDLLGTWTSNSQKETWELKRYSDEKDKRYRLIHTDRENGKQGRFLVTFGKLNDTLFVDLYPENIQSDTSGFYQMHQLSVHTFARIEEAGPELKVRMMDPDTLIKALKTCPNPIKHEIFDGKESKIILTASTEDLQKFVAKHANDCAIFSHETILMRKTQEPNDTNSTTVNKN